jgi:hypothetical protein
LCGSGISFHASHAEPSLYEWSAVTIHPEKITPIVQDLKILILAKVDSSRA